MILNGIAIKELQKMVKVSPSSTAGSTTSDRQLIGPDGRANPEFISYPTQPGQQGRYLYLYGPKMVTVRGVVHQRLQPPQHCRRQYERRDCQHRLDHPWSDDRHFHRLA